MINFDKTQSESNDNKNGMLSSTFLNNPDCKECMGIYLECIPCLKDNLKENFINWTSGNAKIDTFIQEKQLEEIDSYNTTIFEWIPYSQFNYVKKIGEGDLSTATWKDGPLDYIYKKWVRKPDLKVAL